MKNKFYFDDLWHPTPKQQEATAALKKYKYILYGGAMGGGKSYWLRWALADLLTDWAERGIKGVRVGLFCEDYPSLKDRHLSKIFYEFPTWLGELNKADHEFVLNKAYGSGVICFRNLDDASKYQSAEFAAVAVDELTKNKKEMFDFLRTRMRWPGIPDTKFLGATNPGGIGHGWVKKLWIEKEYESTEQEADQFKFISAKAADNPYLSQEYYKSLEGLPEEMRRAFVEGDWNLFKGQYFTEWRDDKHVIPPFPMSESWKKFRAYDHGKEAPACCLWFALDYEGRVWVYREFYQRGMNVDQIASEINRLSFGEVYDYSVADSSIFSSTGMVDRTGGETIGQTFAKNGINFYPASKRRVDGWNLMHQYLHYTKEKLPKMMFFSTCYNTIKTIPTLIHDELHPEDLDTKGEDHAADTIRYFLAMLHDRRTAKPVSEIERKLQQKKLQSESVVEQLRKLYDNEPK